MKTYNILNFKKPILVFPFVGPLSKNQDKKQKAGLAWWDTKPSPYFGQRKKVVTATLKDGSKKPMLLKSALKANLAWSF